MTPWRRYIIRLVLAVLFLLLALVLHDVEAEVDSRSDHRLILELGDELEDELSESESVSDVEDLEIFQQVPRLSESPILPGWSREGEVEGDILVEDEVGNESIGNENYDDLYGGLEFNEGDVDGDLTVEDNVNGDSKSENYEDLYGGPEFSELPHCQNDGPDQERPRPAVVVSTLDGRVTSLDALTGAVLWSHLTGGKNNNMLSSSMSKLEVTSRGEWVRLIPSLDGGIYRFDGDGVEALPVTAETLLHSSFKFSTGTVFTGGKSTEVWGMSANTGHILYLCNASGCRRQQTASRPTHVLVVRRVTQTVRAIDPQSGEERWNFSVGQHELNLAGGGCDWMNNDEEEYLPSLHFVVPDGIIMGMDEEGNLIWQQKLSSPVVNAWKIHGSEIEQIDLFSTNSVPALSPQGEQSYEEKPEQQQPALYVGVHQKQLYIQQSGTMRKKVNSAIKYYSSDFAQEESSFPRVQWRPYLATAVSRTPIVHYNGRKHPLLLSYDQKEENTAVAVAHSTEYPFDNGYYLYSDNDALLNLSRPLEAPTGVPEEDDETIMDDVAAQILHICFHIGPDTWLKLAWGVLCYAVLHFLVLRYILVSMRRQMTEQALNLVTQMLNLIIQNNPHILRLIQRMGVQVPQLLPPPPAPAAPAPAPAAPAPVPADIHPLANNPSVDTTLPEKTEPPSPQFTSRYLTDFEPMHCLGRGGFGVVFQVRNKLDENEYAVKRITLPAKESSAERVKREVRALAKLNHTNIVRYYNSWLETPPPGWQDESLALLQSGSDVLSVSPFSEGAEETRDKGKEESISTCNKDEEPNNSLSEVLNKLSGKNYEKYDDVKEKEKNNGSLSGYEEDNESDNSQDNVDQSFGWSQSLSRAENTMDSGNDSFEILFENSGAKLETNKNEKNTDDSTTSRFGDSTNFSAVGEMGFHKLTDDHSQSIVFEGGENDSISVNSSQSNVFYDKSSSQERNSQSKSKDSYCTHKKLRKRRRLRSHPATNSKDTSERPRTLSLQTSVENVTSHAKDEVPALRSRTFLYIQMELCQKESLKDWLLQHQNRNKKVICDIFNDIVRAVEYVHDNHLMHRDLKPSNIFFSLDGEIKIGDFGLVTTIAEDLRTPGDVQPSYGGTLPSSHHTHRVGTQLYMSPEQVTGQVYDYKVDIYSLGLIFFEMLVPFTTGMERLTVMTRVREGKFPDGFVENFPDETELLKLMLSTNPDLRPTTRGIRARNPLRPLQGISVNDIQPEDHFRLSRQRSQAYSQSSSYSVTSSNSSSR